MIYALRKPISVHLLAKTLGIDYQGTEQLITHIASLNETIAGCLYFSTQPLNSPLQDCFVIAPHRIGGATGLLASDQPRLDFIRALYWLRDQGCLPEPHAGVIDPTAVVDSTAIVASGANIGARCQVGSGAHIHASVTLGKHVIVGSGSVIGHDGFGFERDQQGRPLRFPHLGRVVVDDYVEIGQLCTVARGVLEDTHIATNVKIDDQSYIAHNVSVGANTLIMSGVRLNGRVHVGKLCWIGTGALIREGCNVGDSATVGMGSVVIHNVGSGQTVLGNPAKTSHILSTGNR